MRVVMFYHSLISDWNHGNAHFLRGVASELIGRGHDVVIYEDYDAWSVQNLIEQSGSDELQRYRTVYPRLQSVRYRSNALDLDEALRDVDLVLVHEWNSAEMVKRIGNHRALHGKYRLIFHDTHHRGVTDSAAMETLDLANYDGVLVFGKALREVYIRQGWADRVWVWHEAADHNVFRPLDESRSPAPRRYDGDIAWVGNWGDEERNDEIREYLIGPVRQLGLNARVYGVRYPPSALRELENAGIEYAGWIPNYRVPQVYARFRATVHIPRRPYVEVLPGIPTIRVFEALACGIPLICSYWPDAEHLFTPGSDYLVARDGEEMKRHMSMLLSNSDFSASQARRGLQTVLARHTCAHRVNELFHIYAEMNAACAGALG